MNGSVGCIAFPGWIFLKCALKMNFKETRKKTINLQSIIIILRRDESSENIQSLGDGISMAHSANFDGLDFLDCVHLLKMLAEVGDCEFFAAAAAIVAHWADDLLVELARVPDVHFSALAF